jgi:ComF family protein
MRAGQALRTAARALVRISSPIVETIFPCTCWATGVAITRDERGLCTEAREEIARGVAWPYCTRCGSTTGQFADHSKANPCVRCAVRNLGVRTIARAGTFDKPLSTLVKTLKFHNRPEIAPIVAPFLYQAITLRRLPVDALVPVPLHWRRKISRGYNQSEELARGVAALSGWPMANVLRRTKHTPEQSHAQSVPQRIENLRGAFGCPATQAVAGKHVWLVDDVCTTGATLHAAAMAFRDLPKEARPATINAAVLCVTDWTEIPKDDPG